MAFVPGLLEFKGFLLLNTEQEIDQVIDQEIEMGWTDIFFSLQKKLTDTANKANETGQVALTRAKKAAKSTTDKIIYIWSLEFVLWHDYFRGFNRCDHITPNLLLGRIPLQDSNDLDALVNLKCKAVLTLLKRYETKKYYRTPITAEEYEARGIIKDQKKVRDFHVMPYDDFLEAEKFYDQMVAEGRIVLVHCKAGRGRSAGFAVMKLLTSGKFGNVEDAIREVIRCHPQTNFNNYQYEGLKSFYTEWKTRTVKPLALEPAPDVD